MGTAPSTEDAHAAPRPAASHLQKQPSGDPSQISHASPRTTLSTNNRNAAQIGLSLKGLIKWKNPRQDWVQVKLDLGVSTRVPKSASPPPSSLPQVASLPQGGLPAPPPAGLGLGGGRGRIPSQVQCAVNRRMEKSAEQAQRAPSSVLTIPARDHTSGQKQRHRGSERGWAGREPWKEAVTQGLRDLNVGVVGRE